MRLKTLLKFFTILTLINVIGVLQSNPCHAKDWKKKTFYEDKKYLYFVGRAIDSNSYKDGRQSAIEDAVSNLVGYFGTKVASSFDKKVSVSLSSIGEEFEKKTVSQLSSTGKADLEGLIILDEEYEEKKRKIKGEKVIVYDVFVRLRYSKEAMRREKRRIEEEEKRNLMIIHEGMMDGEDYEKRGDVSSAFQSYLSAIVTSAKVERDDLHTEAVNSLNSLAQRIQIVSIKNNNPGVRALLRTIDENDIPIQNFPIIFTKLGGGKISPIITDKDGIALSNYKTIVSASIDVSNFSIIPSGISDDDRLTVRKAVELIEGKEITFKIKRKSLKVIILISEKNFGKDMEDSIVGNAISEKLYEAGFKVIDDKRMADIKISGNVKTRKGGDTLGYAISAYADAHIKAISLKTGQVVAKKDLLGIKGFAQDEEQAGIKALINLGTQIAEEITRQLLNIE